MKAELHFENASESEELKLCLKARNWHDVAWRIDQYLKQKIKHGNHSEEVEIKLQEVRDELHKYLDMEGVEFI